MKQYSYLSPKCTTKHSKINGIGVFATKKIKKNELITAWGGAVLTAKQVLHFSKKNSHMMTHPITIYSGLYLIPFRFSRLEKADRFNHSCNPNAGVKGQMLLIARRNISSGEEICFDYETTEQGKVDGLPFRCHCGSKTCREVITGKAWKQKNFRKKNKGFFSWYIEQMINGDLPNSNSN